MARISRLNVNLSAQETGLVLFDVLNGFVHTEDPAKAQFLKEKNALPNLQRLLAAARSVGMTTFYATGEHAPDGSDNVDRLTDTDMELRPRADGRSAVIRPQLTRDNWGSRIADELAPLETDVVSPKNRWNAFFGTNLDLQLRVRGITTIVIAGGSTDVGIASTLYAARDLDYGIVAVSDACYSARGNNHEFFMERVFPRMGRVMTVDQAAALMTP